MSKISPKIMDFGCSPKGCQRDQSSCVVRHGFEMFWCQLLSTVAKLLQNGHYKLLFVTLWSQRSNWHQQWSKCKKHLQISQSRVAKLLVSLVSQHSQRVQVSLAAETVARSQFRRVQDLHATDIFPSGPDCWRQLASSRVIQTSILKNEQLLVPEASNFGPCNPISQKIWGSGVISTYCAWVFRHRGGSALPAMLQCYE